MVLPFLVVSARLMLRRVSAAVNGLETLVTFLFVLQTVIQMETAPVQECVSAIMDGLEMLVTFLFVLETVIQMETAPVQEISESWKLQ